MNGKFQVSGKNAAALFTLKLHRSDGMTLVAMNWQDGKPPQDFVGFAIEYKEPDGDRFFALKNRLSFPGAAGAVPRPKRRWHGWASKRGTPSSRCSTKRSRTRKLRSESWLMI